MFSKQLFKLIYNIAIFQASNGYSISGLYEPKIPDCLKK